MKNDIYPLDSYESATLIIDLVQFSGNEDMFIAFMDEFECKFDFCTREENTTILHACETNNFSDSTLLRLLLRPEGRFMFNSEDTRSVQDILPISRSLTRSVLFVV